MLKPESLAHSNHHTCAHTWHKNLPLPSVTCTQVVSFPGVVSYRATKSYHVWNGRARKFPITFTVETQRLQTRARSLPSTRGIFVVVRMPPFFLSPNSEAIIVGAAGSQDLDVCGSNAKASHYTNRQGSYVWWTIVFYFYHMVLDDFRLYLARALVLAESLRTTSVSRFRSNLFLLPDSGEHLINVKLSKGKVQRA